MEVDAANVCQRVVGKANTKSKQGLSRVVRHHTPKGSKETQVLVVEVGHGVTLDYCPNELWIVIEIDAFVQPTKQK